MKERFFFIAVIAVILGIQITSVITFRNQRKALKTHLTNLEFVFFNTIAKVPAFSLQQPDKFLIDATGRQFKFKDYFTAHQGDLFIREVKDACDICIIETLKQIDSMHVKNVVLLIPDTSRQIINMSTARYGSNVKIFGCSEGAISLPLDKSKSSYCFKLDTALNGRMVFFPSYDQPLIIGKYLNKVKN